MERKLSTIRVLLVDDDDDDRLIIERLFAKIPNSAYSIEHSKDYRDASIQILKRCHDVYLIDYKLGERNGVELLINNDAHNQSEPFIILTGARDATIERSAMRAGAAEYLVKGTFDCELLDRVIRYSIQRKQVEQERVNELMAINAAKDEFISLASHQLRTPATIVKQYLGMLLDGYAGDITVQQRAMMITAYDGNERQIQIVNDLLRVAQVDAGQITLHKNRLDIAPLLKQIVSEQQGKFKQVGQSLVFKNAKRVHATASIDELHLRMALENIIDNACKYSPRNGTTSVKLEVSDGMAIIKIADQGVGIPPEKHDKLFQKFSRIDNPLSTKVGGTGLGLYLTKTIIKLHDGNIKIDSEEGKGTQFTIEIPHE